MTMAKIVVMDDENTIRMAITKVMERDGHEV